MTVWRDVLDESGSFGQFRKRGKIQWLQGENKGTLEISAHVFKIRSM
jgi:hypothetical protein